MKTFLLILLSSLALNASQAQTYTPRLTAGVTSVNDNTGAVTGAQAVAGAVIDPSSTGATTPGTGAFTSVTTPTISSPSGTTTFAGNITTSGMVWASTIKIGNGSLAFNSSTGFNFNSSQVVNGGISVTGNLTASGSITNGATGTAVKNRRFVTATLTSGTVMVSDTAITATTQIYPSNYTTTGSVGIPYLSSRTAGTGYTISDSNSAATNQVSVEIVDF